MKLTSRYARNVPIESTYNATQGLPRDIEKCNKAFDLVGTTAAWCIRERWMEFFDRCPDGHYLEIAHSGGAAQVIIAGLLMPEECRKRISAVTIAGQSGIPKGLFGETFNYRSTHDIVPHFQKISGNSVMKKAEVTVLQRHPDAPRFDHGYSSPTYEKTLKVHLKEFTEGFYDN